MQSPDLVTNIVSETAARIRPALDLRSFQSQLWYYQKLARDPRRKKSEEKRRKMRLYRWRNRVRLELPGREGFKVQDRIQLSDGRKYLELSNGMRVRVDQASRLTNPALIKTIFAELVAPKSA